MSAPAADLAAAADRLRGRLRDVGRLIVAFSGGADSALLAWTAHEVLGEAMVAVTAVSASLPGEERRAAKAFADRYAIPHVEVCTDELERPEYRLNDGLRCFHCKSALFDALEPMAKVFGAQVALGTNLDDLADFRPGQRAAASRGAIAPLVDAGLDKQTVRALSARAGLPTSDKPAAACLASRVAYGDPVSAELLGRVEQAELVLHEFGWRECRVRSHAGGTVARIEVPPAVLGEVLAARAELDERLRACGFSYVTVDLAGLRSGSMNALLTIRPAR